MPNRSHDALFQLIQSLQKGEKRNFKLYVQRNSSNEDLRIVQLFDAMDKMKEYDEAMLLAKNPAIKKAQLSNIRAQLYREILSSLRLLQAEDNISLQLHEQLDYAWILYNRGLYLQSLRILDKIKEMARANQQISFLVQVLFLEKKIETLHITRSMEDRATRLATDANEVNENLLLVTKLSNLSLELYSWYIKHGHARNEQDELQLTGFFNEHMPEVDPATNSFYQKLYLYQSYSWYAFIRQDYLMYYRYTNKWVELFRSEPLMTKIETAHYIKGLHNLLTAHFNLRNHRGFDESLQLLEELSDSDLVMNNDNNRVQVFIYLNIARLNRHFIHGSFDEGLGLVTYIEEKLDEYSIYLDRHRVLVFYYKIASLYFGSGDFDRSIDYLNKIINWKIDLRNDLQCYARLLNLIAHYELGNFDLLEYLTKSVYRFMAKMETLGVVEEEIFGFLKKALRLSPSKLKPEFVKLHSTLKQLENERSATRAFAYLDFISWLESKIHYKPVKEIIFEKFRQNTKIKPA